MYKIKVNEQFNFDIELDGKNLKVNNERLEVDIAELDARSSNILYLNRSYNTEIVSINKAEKTCRIKVNGNIYEVLIADQYDQLLKQLGMDNLATNKVLEVKAPMPGLVLNIMIEEGREVKKGDSLLILEAMKMENILKSPTDGVVKKVMVAKGQKVEKNQILVQFK